MHEANERFGVVNVVLREQYEKKFQLPYGYNFISYSKHEAIKECKKLKKPEYVVERIFDSLNPNMKEVIYKNEKND